MNKISLQDIQSRQKGTLSEMLGFEIIGFDEHGLTASMEIKAHHLAPNGYLHAASIITLADTACGYGCMLTLPEGANSFTTIELKSNHLGTAREGKLEVLAKPVQCGRTTQVWDATVSAAGKKPSPCFVAHKWYCGLKLSLTLRIRSQKFNSVTYDYASLIVPTIRN